MELSVLHWVGAVIGIQTKEQVLGLVTVVVYKHKNGRRGFLRAANDVTPDDFSKYGLDWLQWEEYVITKITQEDYNILCGQMMEYYAAQDSLSELLQESTQT
jgi:hypothetical protein